MPLRGVDGIDLLVVPVWAELILTVSASLKPAVANVGSA